MRKVLSTILSTAVLGGALLLCPPSYAAASDLPSAHITTRSAAHQMPTRLKCITLGPIRSC